jgi:hypothetical protein
MQIGCKSGTVPVLQSFYRNWGDGAVMRIGNQFAKLLLKLLDYMIQLDAFSTYRVGMQIGDSPGFAKLL